ncbi:MAG: TRAP transporter small permease [Geminicoccaceae bacterium]
MKPLLGGLKTAHDLVTEAAAALAVLGLGLIVFSYVFEVFTRYVLNSPTSWVSDFVSYALSASVFLALPKVTRERGHVAVTILVDILPDRVADWAHAAVSLMGFACLGFAAWISLEENIRQYSRGIETLAINPIPVWWVSSFITFGLAMSALYMLRHLPPSCRSRNGFQADGPD